MDEIYEPAEDSYLMSEVLKQRIKNPDLSCLEIGVGSGIQLQTLKKIGVKYIKGVDINKKAVMHCRKLGFDCLPSDLFSSIKENEKFDFIIFNPPYLPKDKREPKDSQKATTGGKLGSIIINKFLQQAKSHLKPEGKILLLTSSLTKGIKWLDYKKKLISKKKIFMEELYVWELTI